MSLPETAIIAKMISAPVLGIDRHRIDSDGNGVRTLVAFYGCPLHCRYCLNDRCHDKPAAFMLTEELLKAVCIDDIYFRASGGGVTFGGGEPMLYPAFINEFRQISPDGWSIVVETSLNVDHASVEKCADAVDRFIVDIKTTDPCIYADYTGLPNHRVLDNLRWLISAISPDRITARVPDIEGFTSEADINATLSFINHLGITDIDRFSYSLPGDFDRLANTLTAHCKEICHVLKRIRGRVAHANGLMIDLPECKYSGPCRGTCPKCESELQTITTYIHTLETFNTAIKILP